MIDEERSGDVLLWKGVEKGVKVNYRGRYGLMEDNVV
jgi:hypothetical protein